MQKEKDNLKNSKAESGKKRLLIYKRRAVCCDQGTITRQDKDTEIRNIKSHI